jgi:hypothetical protein
MKKQLMFSLAAILIAARVFGQVESDDMYFNSKDRAKLNAEKANQESAYIAASAKKTKKADQSPAKEEVVNPTDSYSARNVNPEFAARSNSQTATADNQDYFVNNYKYNNSSNLNNWNNDFNGWYNNAWYGANYYNPAINSWNTPYYGSYYDSWGNPWCNPYYRSGYSSSFSYYWGSSWNYGWGSGIGMGYGYGNPYMNSWYSWGAYPGYGYGGYGYGYPSTVIIVNNGGDYGSNVVYGKRASRGGMVTEPQREVAYTRPRTDYVSPTRPSDTGGRVSTSGRSQRQEDYYNRAWRNSQQTSSYSSPSRNSNSSFESWNGNSSSDSWNRHDSNSSFSPSRSSSNSSFSGGGGGATRQSAPASSGSNGRTRGRD